MSLICPNCERVFKRNPEIIRHRIWCDGKIEFFTKYNISPEHLDIYYRDCGSVLEFMRKFPHWKSFKTYYQLFKEFNIEVSLKHAANHDLIKDKRKKSNTEKYGSEHNFCRDHPSRLQWQQRLKDEEGITNVFQREDVKQKSAETILTKYQKELWLHGLTIRGSGIISKLNKQIFSILDELKIKYFIEFKLPKPNGFYYAYDILLDNSNKIIEVYGNYWHGNPLIYKSTDLLLKGSSKEMTYEEKWKLDSEKNKLAENAGFTVLVIWEKEIKENYDGVVSLITGYASINN